MGLGIKLTAGCGNVLDKKCEGLFNFWHKQKKMREREKINEFIKLHYMKYMMEHP